MERIGQYKVICDLGGGGMSSVLLARSYSGDLVVLKRQHDPRQDEVLRDEARAGIVLDHPSIVETLDLVEHEGRPILVLAFVPGATLYDLRQLGPTPASLVFRVGRQICEGLDVIHTAHDEQGRHLGILHRDVTAKNIMVGYDGNGRLIDLGIARSAMRQADQTAAGVLKGTLRYMAPELFLTGKYTVATELWSLGMSLWEAALGRPGVDARSPPELIARISQGRAMERSDDEEVDLRLERVLAQLLSVNPDDRPQSAADAAALFRDVEDQFSNFDQVARKIVVRAVGPAPNVKLPDDELEVAMRKSMAGYSDPAEESSDEHATRHDDVDDSSDEGPAEETRPLPAIGRRTAIEIKSSSVGIPAPVSLPSMLPVPPLTSTDDDDGGATLSDEGEALDEAAPSREDLRKDRLYQAALDEDSDEWEAGTISSESPDPHLDALMGGDDEGASDEDEWEPATIASQAPTADRWETAVDPLRADHVAKALASSASASAEAAKDDPGTVLDGEIASFEDEDTDGEGLPSLASADRTVHSDMDVDEIRDQMGPVTLLDGAAEPEPDDSATKPVRKKRRSGR